LLNVYEKAFGACIPSKPSLHPTQAFHLRSWGTLPILEPFNSPRSRMRLLEITLHFLQAAGYIR
jgi:hypothetical protein